MPRSKGYIFDLDGTLFRGAEAIPHAVDVVSELEQSGAQIAYLTNNSSMRNSRLAEKLRGMGFPARDEQVVGTAWGVTQYLPAGSKCYVVGSPDLMWSVSQRHEIVDVGADHVVVGICRELSYRHLDMALQNLLAGAKFVATNTDVTYPKEGGQVQPGAGAMVGALSGMVKRPPDVVIGKPEPYLVNLILKQFGLPASDVLMVGDRYETDILAGERAGCPTHLVLTGVATAAPTGLSSSPDLRGLL